jgi:hypothetical protein
MTERLYWVNVVCLQHLLAVKRAFSNSPNWALASMLFGFLFG